MVVEDAVSGVQAGAKGGFGLTLGLDREGNREALEKNGADLVLNDISELGGIKAIDEWFEKKVPELKWKFSHHDYDPDKGENQGSPVNYRKWFFCDERKYGRSEASPEKTITIPDPICQESTTGESIKLATALLRMKIL